jgi:hypothetical protein
MMQDVTGEAAPHAFVRGVHGVRYQLHEVIIATPQARPGCVEESNGRGGSHGPGDVRGARLKFQRAMLEVGPFEVDVVRHVATHVIRRHCVQQLTAAPDHACAHRPQHLVP